MLDKPHATANLAHESLLEVPLAGEAAGGLCKDGGRDAAALDGAPEDEDGVGEGALLGHEVVELVGDDGRGDQELVDVRGLDAA